MTGLRRVKKQPSVFPVMSFYSSPLLFFFFSCLLLVVTYNYFYHHIIFPVHRVSVQGVHYLDREKFRDGVLPLVRDGFFSLRPGRIRERLLQMPWVADASVVRVWPDRVMIAVSEREPVARWNQAALISAAGIVFSPDTQTFPAGLPIFIGPEGAQTYMLTLYHTIEAQLQLLGMTIAKIELMPAQFLVIDLTNGIRFYVGPKDILTRIIHFVKVYPHVVGTRADQVDYIDLRYPDGFAVRWKKGVTHVS